MDQNILNHSPVSDALLKAKTSAFDEKKPALTSYDIASSWIAKGEAALLKGELSSGLECFDFALKFDPDNPKVFFAQGLALFEYGSDEGQEKALPMASKKFKSATLLNPEYFEAWQAWGSLLYSLGENSGEHHYFKEAKEKLNKAVNLSVNQNRGTLAELYWELGSVFLQLAEHSGESLDWHESLEALHLAYSFDEKLPCEFWNDLGYACFKFGMQINDSRLYLKAAHYLKTAVALDSFSLESWTLLAQVFEKLYFHTHDEDYFSQANECFASATQASSEESEVWLKWSRFLCDCGKRTADIKRLRLSVEKAQRAASFNSDNPLIYAVWAEALSLLGSNTDRLDLIQDAHNKISQAVEWDEDSPEIWYSFGVCLQALGRYFNDSDYYYQAIEKFQTGISINRTCHPHWHAIGLTYSLLGDLENNPENLELSLRFFQKALDLHFSSYYLFDYATTLSKLGEITHEQNWLEQASIQFERLLNTQKNAVYLHPDWLFQYAITLDCLGDFHEEELYYERAIDILSHVLIIDPDFTSVHHRLGLSLSHLGELTHDADHFYRAIHHYRLALKTDEENDTILMDWAVSLINLATHSYDPAESEEFFRAAEYKIQTAMGLGNLQSYYHFTCLCSLQGHYEKAIHFLKKARQCDALPPLDEILQDDWLDNLRITEEFQEFIAQLQRNLSEE